MKVFRCLCWSVFGVILLVSNGSAQSTVGIISTVAGNDGLSGFSGDGGPATAAAFNIPLGIAVDATGNLYIADDLNYRIRRVDPSGTITTFAGNGTRGFAGDGGPAVAAQLSNVFDVAADRLGNIFIADLGNARIRKVTPDGVISTVAGTGPSLPNPSAANGDGGPAIAAQFSGPNSIAVDAAGNLFIADGNNKRVRKVDLNGIITTIASGLNNPDGVAVDAAGNVFIAEQSGNDVLKVNPAGVMTVYAGNGTPGFSGDGGPAASAALISPNGVAVDAAGNLFISCSGFLGGGAFLPITFEDHRVRKVDTSGIITTYAGGGKLIGNGVPATAASLSTNVEDVATDSAGDLFIVVDNLVRKVTQVVPFATVIPATLPVGMVDLTYSQSFSASGGLPPYTWSVTAGTLPSGISLNSITGVLSGLPTGSGGSFSFTLNVTDSLGTTFSQATQITINPLSFGIASGGGVSLTTQDTGATVQAGYGVIQAPPGAIAPSGLAIFGFRENNVLVTEAGVPAVPLILGGRIYAQVSGPVNTGLAIANPNGSAAAITFFFTDAAGRDFGQGSTVIPAGGQIAKFLTEAPFSGGTSIQGTFTFTSTQPVAAVALHGFTNERSEFLITTLPVSPLLALAGQPVIFPHFADGLGWTSEVGLVNPTDTAMSGALQFFGQDGQGLTLTVNGQTASSFSYTIPARSSVRFQTSGGSSSLQGGSVRVTPDVVSGAPAGVLIFSYVNGGITVAQAGVPAIPASLEFRMYAETSGNFAAKSAGSIQTGIAIANTSSSAVTVNLTLTTLAGASTGLTGIVEVPAQGQTALFLNQIPGFESLQTPFRGVLQLSTGSSSPFSSPVISVIGLRGRYNERNDFLITTTAPVASSSSPAASLFIPQLVDGGGYSTQLILFSGFPGLASSGTLQMFTQSGAILSLRLQ